MAKTFIYKDATGKELPQIHQWIDSQSDSMKAAYHDNSHPDDPVSDAKKAVFSAYVADTKAVTITVVDADTGEIIEDNLPAE